MNNQSDFNIAKIEDSEKPEKPKFSTSFVDLTVDPLENFDLYANGMWKSEHSIPADKPSWDASYELMEWNTYILGKILENCALKTSENGIEKMLGDFYISSMNLKKLEERKFSPLKPLMERIEKIESVNTMLELIPELHSMGIYAFFEVYSSGDEKNSSTYALYVNQGGLSLPNRDYYFLDTFKDTREQFIMHVEKMFLIFGCGQAESKKNASVVFNIEKALAKVSRTPVELRDPEKNYNKKEVSQLDKEFNNINFKRYFKLISLPQVDYVIVSQPEFFEHLENFLLSTDIEDFKIYLKWKVLNDMAHYLHNDVFMEHFDFFNRKMRGQKEPEKRWKISVSHADRNLGEALGKLYVDQEFGEDSRRRMNDMVEDLRNVFEERLKSINWMSDETKVKALQKFKRFRAKIGNPTKFIDYSSIVIKRDDFAGNVIRAKQFNFKRYAGRVGKSVDKELWEMTPPTVNAYFSPTDNEIVFPAGILQPPFFDPDLDDAVNYGATGGTIAHEITHGFDDEGRKFDIDGNLKEWWTKEDEEEFLKKANSVVKLYSSKEILPGLKVNGELTLGENIADLGGVSIALEALEKRLSAHPELRKNIDGYTPEQRFFLGWAQSWRMNSSNERIRMLISNDPHSPESLRADIPARVHPRFMEVFKDKSKSKKNNIEEITIW
jgi:predicted metalloendopeptidase